MPTNEFLPWALGVGANVESQAGFAADSARTAGVVAGTARSALYNKAQRQSSFFSTVLATFIVNQLTVDVLDDGDVNDKVTKFGNAVLHIVGTVYATASALAAEIARAEAAETALSDDLAAEIERAETAEAAETARATEAEARIQVPIGGMLLWTTDTPPANFLEANGASLARAGTYAALFAVIGTTFGAVDGAHFTLPDLRGKFARGYDNGAGYDPGRTFGTLQGDAFQNHAHASGVATLGTTDTDVYGPTTQDIPGAAGAVFQRQNATVVSQPKTGGALTGSGYKFVTNETRPVNVALMHIIRYQ